MPKFSDHFNSTTIRGRANVAKVTYASFAAIYLYNRFKKPKKKLPQDNQLNQSNHNNHFPNSEYNDNSLEQFKCPHCESNKDNNNSTDNLQQDSSPFLESKTTIEDFSSKQQLKQDIPSAKAESEMIKSSETKSYYGAAASNNGNDHNNGDSPAPDKGSCP